MSNYPPSNQNFGFPGVSPSYPSHPVGNPNQQYQPYSPANFPTSPSRQGNFSPNSGYQQPNVMSNYPNQPGYPTPGNQPGYPTPGNQPGYPTPGNQPGYPTPGNQPGYPTPDTVCPTAPDISQMQQIPGYEGLTFEDAVLPPPVIPSWQPDQQDRKPLQNLPVLTEEEVRDAAIQFASEHCCYGNKPVRDMQVTDIFMMSAFHYKLETYAEKRESAWRFEPYHGQAIDGPANGPAPSPWEVIAIPHQYFVGGKVKMEVPHTAFVKPCHTCIGNGRIRCEPCFGNGRKQCTWCKGRGRRTEFDRDEMCSSCNGTGTDRCMRCSGTGQVKCKTCDGKGNLKGFVELNITWTNHSDDFISETSSMPKELVLKVSGQTVYEEENPRVYPIMHASEQAVRNASNDLVTKHSTAFANERLLKQRQHLRVIPIGQIKYEWKNKMDEFFVYGFEHQVYFRKYPKKCLCTIL